MAFLCFKQLNLQLTYRGCVDKSQLVETFGGCNFDYQLSPFLGACIEHTHFGTKRFAFVRLHFNARQCQCLRTEAKTYQKDEVGKEVCASGHELGVVAF